MTEESIVLLDALHSVKSGKDVFHALCEVPTENLQDMHDMIVHILKDRLNQGCMRVSSEILA